MIGVAGSGDAREGRRLGVALNGGDGIVTPVSPEDVVWWGIRELCAGSELS